MTFSNNNQPHPGITIFFTFALMFFAVGIGTLILAQSVSWFGYPASVKSEFLKGNFEILAVNFLRYSQIMQSILTFIVPGLAINCLYQNFYNPIFYSRKKPLIEDILLTTILVISVLPIINLMVYYNQKINLPDFLNSLEAQLIFWEETAKSTMEKIMVFEKPHDLYLNLVMIAVIPAIGEEIIFRGILQKSLARWIQNGHIAIIITAFIFSAFHFQFYGFIPRMALGILFGYLYWWSKNIWVCVWAHFVNNGLAVCLYFAYFTNKTEINPDEFGLHFPGDFIVLGVGLLIATVCIYLFATRKHHKIFDEIRNSL